LIDLENRKVLFEKQFSYEYPPVSINPGGKSFVYITDERFQGDKITLTFHGVNIESGEISTLFNHTTSSSWSYYAQPKFSPDGELLAIALRSGEILLVDISSESVFHQWKAQQGEMMGLAFSSDGTMLASYSDDGFVKIWGIWP